ncbi:MAG: ERCC4 domain-containing protein [archaeon]
MIPKISPIFADYREKNSLVIAELFELGAKPEFTNLLVADFIIKNTAIERKTVNDFVNSMINKRLIRQLEEIKQYPHYLLVIEGLDHQELYDDSSKGVHANAIRGFLLSILLEYQVPIIFTKDYRDTAKFLYILAKKQESELGIRAKKRVMSQKEQLQFILEGFPGIGPKTAKKLLSKFKTLKKIINSPLEDLKKEIGKKAEIFSLTDKFY